jgi:hypothetical protein
MKSKKYEENVRGKGRMGNSTYVVINKVKMRARYKQASMVLCKPGLYPPTHRKVYGVPLRRSIQKKRKEKKKKKKKNPTPHQMKSMGALKNPVRKSYCVSFALQAFHWSSTSQSCSSCSGSQRSSASEYPDHCMRYKPKVIGLRVS